MNRRYSWISTSTNDVLCTRRHHHCKETPFKMCCFWWRRPEKRSWVEDEPIDLSWQRHMWETAP